jgi:hypothetical protein
MCDPSLNVYHAGRLEPVVRNEPVAGSDNMPEQRDKGFTVGLIFC